MKELKTKKAYEKELLKQDFYPHTLGDGKIIKVSADGKYWYWPKY